MAKRITGIRKQILIIITTIVLLGLFFYWQNNDIVITSADYTNAAVPAGFDGFRILQVSDLHNKEFGKNQKGLMKLTRKIQPDIIVITGDLIDSYRPDVETAMDYVRQAVEIAPVYFVTGNHEMKSVYYTELSRQLTDTGVNIMDDRAVLLKKNKASIILMGLGDPYFLSQESGGEEIIKDKLNNISGEEAGTFKILLSHRPELFKLYAEHNIELVFSGHAHGGQFRLPLIGGLYAPNQGFFPGYTNGIIVNKNTSMVVSRGLGNSVIPVRIFNRPELVVVTLRHID